MPKFGQKSLITLATCHPKLQMLFNKVVEEYNCTVLEGFRTGERQDELYRTGMSKLKFPNSKHNQQPSIAVDVAPYFSEAPHIRWNDKESFYHFGGYVKGVASQMGIKIRWGGDWDGDNDLHDQSFMDLPHFELVFDD
jgi:peptidoglycan LD-endopeptidase CwlK